MPQIGISISNTELHCKNKRVDVTHLGLCELHVHTSRSVIFLDHCRSPITDKRYSIKLGHAYQLRNYRNVRSEAALITFPWLLQLRNIISAALLA